MKDMRNDWKYRFLHWLNRNDDHKINPFLFFLLFPSYWMANKQKHLKYDPFKRIFYIKGVNYSEEMFDNLSGLESPGRSFQFVKLENGTVTVKSTICECQQSLEGLKKEMGDLGVNL